MSSPDLKVVTLFEHSLRDVAGKLRQLADDIESGTYGEVTCLGVALMGNTFEIFGFGDGINGESVSPSIACLFRAGSMRIEKEIESFGR